MGIAEVIDAKSNNPVEEVMRLTDGKGADAVIAAVGNTIAYKQGALRCSRRWKAASCCSQQGYPQPEMQINPNEIHYRRLEIIGTMNADVADFVDAAFMISNKIVNCSYSLEGRTFPLRDIQEAYKAAATPVPTASPWTCRASNRIVA